MNLTETENTRNKIELNRIAIVSCYFNNINYGGSLQSFATCKAVEKCGYYAEQLCFPIETSPLTPTQSVKKKRTLKDLEIDIKVYIYNLLISNRHRRAEEMSEKRTNAFTAFNENIIPHSDEIYSEKNIMTSLSKYDLFITGSDLVWNPNWYSTIFALEFVPENVPKFSYAPSMGVTELNDKEKEVYRNFLKNYQAVSVREQNAVDILKDLSPVPVEWVLDPTLLLGKEEWNSVCSERIVDEKYMFCYFLGSNPNSRELARQYAQKHNLKLVTIPYLLGKYRGCDWKFGDIQLSDVSPQDFISLIRYADCVFTDSFHACVFSFIYQKEFFAFRRDAWADGIGSRISSFLGLIDCISRYCDADDKENEKYIESISKIDYSVPFVKFDEMKNKSMDYLERNLKLAKETIKNNGK